MRGYSGQAVAIVDLVMPGMDGWHLIDIMRASTDLSRIPIIVLSVHVREPIAGADLMMKKPYVPAELVAAVRNLCH